MKKMDMKNKTSCKTNKKTKNLEFELLGF